MPDPQPTQMEQGLVTDAMIFAGRDYLLDFGIDDMDDAEVEGIYLAMHAARPTADLGDDGELVARLRDESLALQRVAWSRPDGGQDACIAASLADQAADRLILYREALEEARAIVAASAGACEEFSGPSEETRLLDILDTALTQARQEGDK